MRYLITILCFLIIQNVKAQDSTSDDHWTPPGQISREQKALNKKKIEFYSKKQEKKRGEAATPNEVYIYVLLTVVIGLPLFFLFRNYSSRRRGKRPTSVKSGPPSLPLQKRVVKDDLSNAAAIPVEDSRSLDPPLALGPKSSNSSNPLLEVVNRYKKLIFIWTAVNLFALMVNAFDIYGEFSSDLRLFCRPARGGEGFWPFVKIVEHIDKSEYYYDHDHDYYALNGLFYKYDLSEFIFYLVVLGGILTYIAFIKKPKTKDNLSLELRH